MISKRPEVGQVLTLGCRYRQSPLKGPKDLLNAVREIHRTPIEQDTGRCASDGLWSSHGAYGGASKPAWLNTGRVMRAVRAEYGGGGAG